MGAVRRAYSVAQSVCLPLRVFATVVPCSRSPFCRLIRKFAYEPEQTGRTFPERVPTMNRLGQISALNVLSEDG